MDHFVESVREAEVAGVRGGDEEERRKRVRIVARETAGDFPAAGVTGHKPSLDGWKFPEPGTRTWEQAWRLRPAKDAAARHADQDGNMSGFGGSTRERGVGHLIDQGSGEEEQAHFVGAGAPSGEKQPESSNSETATVSFETRAWCAVASAR